MRNLIAVASLLIASVAAAQNNRSAVSRNGLDTNPCTVASPCRSFGAAIAVTNSGGDLVALDSGGYGPFGIDRSITVGGAPGVEASITAAGSNVIAIAVVADGFDVVIRNLVLIGVGGESGIESGQVRDLYVFNCLIRGFNNFGILASIFTGANVNIEHCRILDMGGGMPTYGVYLRGAQGHPIHALIHDCIISGSAINVWINDNAFATITDSTISDAQDTAVFVSSHSGTGTPADAVVESCNIANNNIGLRASSLTGNNVSHVVFSNNVFAFNTTAVYREINGTVTSLGNNRFMGNSTDSFPAPFPAIGLK